MIGLPSALVMAVLTLIAVTTVFHAFVVLGVLAWRRHRLPPPPAAAAALPPVTWFRPLKSGVRDLRSKLSVFLNALPADDQVLFGVDPGSEADGIARELAGSSSQNVRVIECRKGAAKNPKVSKLLQIAEFTRHEHWIILDSEAIVGPAFASAFRSGWQQTGADLITAGYRFSGTANLLQRLDAMSTVLTLWPGLEIVRTFGTMRFTLGACTGVRRSDLQAIGGWASLGDALPEDYWLGERLSRLGKTVCLSEAIVTLDADDLTWGEYWRHQLRVAATYRCAQPAGTAGMILTRGVSAALLATLLHPLAGTFLLILALVTRVALAEAVAATHGFPLKGSPLALVLISDVVESAAWLRAWFVRSVWWGGRSRRITWRGKLRT